MASENLPGTWENPSAVTTLLCSGQHGALSAVLRGNYPGIPDLTRKEQRRLGIAANNGIQAFQRTKLKTPAQKATAGHCLVDGEICTMRKILPDSFALVQWGVNSAAMALSQQCPGKLVLLNNLEGCWKGYKILQLSRKIQKHAEKHE